VVVQHGFYAEALRAHPRFLLKPRSLGTILLIRHLIVPLGTGVVKTFRWACQRFIISIHNVLSRGVIAMHSASVAVKVSAESEAIFDFIHDYSRRLEWDPFLSEATLLNGATCAGIGVVTRCVARKALGGLAMDTEYVSFSRPTVAAVSMTRGPMFIRKFAASIRQKRIGDNTTLITYRYHFEAQPRFLAFLIEPVMGLVFKRETEKRLAALKSYLE
jgi:hypothetical protein